MNLNDVFEEDVLDRYNDYTVQIANDDKTRGKRSILVCSNPNN